MMPHFPNTMFQTMGEALDGRPKSSIPDVGSRKGGWEDKGV